MNNKIKKINPDFFDIFTHMTKEELITLYELALSLKSSSIIAEIGSYLGASSTFLASAAREKNHKVYCIDTWQNDAMSEGKRDTFSEFSKNIEPVKNYICVKRGSSEDIAREFNEKIDLLFLDGDHSYEAVKRDFDLYFPKMNKKSIIAIHDIGWAEGVQKVVRENVLPKIAKYRKLPNLWWGWIKD